LTALDLLLAERTRLYREFLSQAGCNPATKQGFPFTKFIHEPDEMLAARSHSTVPRSVCSLPNHAQNVGPAS